MRSKKVPDVGMGIKEMPPVGTPENTIMVNGIMREIKPTKLKYVRNGTANFYRLIERVPLTDIMQLQSGAFGEDDPRDGDKAIMDFLIAVFDDEQFVVDNYDDFDTEQILRIVEIFKRLNHFTEVDSKNAESPRTEA